MVFSTPLNIIVSYVLSPSISKDQSNRYDLPSILMLSICALWFMLKAKQINIIKGDQNMLSLLFDPYSEILYFSCFVFYKLTAKIDVKIKSKILQSYNYLTKLQSPHNHEEISALTSSELNFII